MNRRAIGITLVALGGAMILGGALLATSGSTEPAASGTGTATTTTTTTTTTVSDPAEPTPSTTSPSTTAVPATTTTVAETVEAFIEMFASAIASGDTGFVLSRLHPRVIDGFTIDVCQAWVAAEIMGLSDYEMVGEPIGPQNRDFSVAGSSVRINDVYDVQVRFSFGGQSFDSTASFALVDGLLHWLGTCE